MDGLSAYPSVSVFDAESVVIGSLLRDPASYARTSRIVEPDDFNNLFCRAVFVAAAEVAARGELIFPAAIALQLANDQVAFTDQQMQEFLDTAPSATVDEDYARVVSDYAKMRKIQELANVISERITSGSRDVQGVLADALERFKGVTSTIERGRCLSSHEAMLDFIDQLSDRTQGKRNVVPSGYPQLDALLGVGFLNSGLYIIAARPGVGKTTFALNVAEKIAEQGENILFVSLEMSAEQISAKRVSRASGIATNKLSMSSSLSDEELSLAAEEASRLSQNGFYINRGVGHVTVAEIGIMARSYENLTAVVVDYLGLIRSTEHGSRYEQVTQISADLKRLAVSLKVPVIALSQLSRASEQRQDKRPSLADLRDSGSIEQDADGVLLLFRPDYYDDTDSEKSEPVLLECTVAKNRHAETGRLCFEAYLSRSCIIETRTRKRGG